MHNDAALTRRDCVLSIKKIKKWRDKLGTLSTRERDEFRASLKDKTMADLEGMFNQLTAVKRHAESPRDRVAAGEKLIILRGARNGYILNS